VAPHPRLAVGGRSHLAPADLVRVTPTGQSSNVHQTDLGMFTSVSARKQRTLRYLGLASDKQVEDRRCQAERGSRKSVLPQYEPAPTGQRPICRPTWYALHLLGHL
jgi:hypothetical protein